MSSKSKKSPKYDWNQATMTFDPIAYTQTDSYKKALSDLAKAISESSANTAGVASTLQGYYDRVMDPNYSALSKDQMQNFYQQGVEMLKPQFKEMESNLGSRMANQGLAGSGIAGAEWSGLGKKQSEALADVYNNIYNQNLATTQQNIANALGSTGTLASLYQQPVSNQTLLTNIYGSDQAAINAWNQWNKQMEQAAKATSIGAYQNWYNQASQSAAQNRANLGNAIGTGLGILFK